MDGNNNSTNRFFAKVRHRLYPFFWFIASSNEKVLRASPTQEQDKHFGYGMAILLTAMAAVVSGFFAFMLIIHRVIPALLVAILWGFLILNLDRIMVGSMKKDAQNRRSKELLPVLPRILLAAVIAMVISKPIEVELLKNQIEADQVKNREKEIAGTLEIQDAAIKSRRSVIADAENAIEKLEKDRENILKERGYINLKSQYEKCRIESQRISQDRSNYSSALHTLGSNAVYSYEDVSQDSNGVIKRVRKLNNEGNRERERLKSLINNLSLELKELNCSQVEKQLLSYVENKNKRIDEIQANKDTIISRGEKWATTEQNIRDKTEKGNKEVLVKADQDFFGLLDDLGTLKANNSNIWWASLFLSMLFFILEIAPIFVKWINERGIYDELLEAEESDIRKEIRLKAAENQIQLQSAIASGEAYLNADTQANQELLSKVMAAQSIIGQKMVEEWQNSELEKLNDNREAYLKEHIIQP